VPLASIPSPARSSWRLGPLPVHAYALCVVAGIVVAIVVASRRYRQDGARQDSARQDGARQNGDRRGVILDVAAWAVPFGLAGAVVHAVLVAARHDFKAIAGLWHAATVGVALLGVPGAVALGAAGAWVACRRAGIRLGPVAGAAAPAVTFGLALASLGNWWEQQFYGPPSSWWWAVQISPTRRDPGYENFATFQPLFLYQALWDLVVGLAVIWVARRLALSGARTFLLAAAAYAAGAFWAQLARIGPLTRLLGLRYGALEDAVVFVLTVAVLYFTRPRPARAPRTHPRTGPVSFVDDSSGDVMSS
jgi:prolipoprotein diacylglyceryltransferase